MNLAMVGRALANALLGVGYAAGMLFVWIGLEMYVIDGRALEPSLLSVVVGITLWALMVEGGRRLSAGPRPPSRACGTHAVLADAPPRRAALGIVPLAAIAVLLPGLIARVAGAAIEGGSPPQATVDRVARAVGGWLQAIGSEWLDAALDETAHFTAPDRFAAGLGEYALLFPVGMSLMWIVFAMLFFLRRESRLPWDPRTDRSIAVVVPARNEEAGIAATIESLLAQDLRAMTIHVVSDASTDATAEIARRYASRGVIVHELRERHGKAGALQVALDASDCELFMVVDADTVCEPGAIRAMTQQFADPRIAGVTGNPRVADPQGFLPRMQSMEYLGIIGLIKRADSFWGGLFTVSGAAACFRTDALRAVGGWTTASVTEDIELSWRLQKAGHELAYEPRAHFAIQAPTGIAALHRQRRRWAQGMCETLRLHGNLASTRNAALIPLAAQSIASMFWMVITLATAGLWLLATITGLGFAGRFDPATAARLLACTTALFVAQTALACLWESDARRAAGQPGAWRLLPLALLFPAYYWIVIAPSFIAGAVAAATTRGKTRHWERTSRTGEAGSRQGGGRQNLEISQRC